MAETIHIHQELVEKSKRGERLAQYQLYQLYSKAMFNICYRMMNGREEAEDMLQEAFTTVFHRLDSFRNESTIGAWIKRIVVNQCINELKRKKLDLTFRDDVAGFEGAEEEVDDSHIQYEVSRIRTAMEALPQGYRIIFSLYLLEGYDHREISEILNISESTSKTQYLRAKNKIKVILNEQSNGKQQGQ